MAGRWGAGLPAITEAATAVMRMVLADPAQTPAPLAAAGTWTGAAVDQGESVIDRGTHLRVSYCATAAVLGAVAHLQLAECADPASAPWREVGRVPLPADGGLYPWEWTLRRRWWRLSLLNGPTAQSGLDLTAQVIRGEDAATVRRPNLALVLTPAPGQVVPVSSSWTSQVLTLGAVHGWDRVRAVVRSDAGGTAVLEESYDGATWVALGASLTLTAGTVLRTEQQITLRQLRLRVLTGLAPATVSAHLSLIPL